MGFTIPTLFKLNLTLKNKEHSKNVKYKTCLLMRNETIIYKGLTGKKKRKGNGQLLKFFF